MSIHTGNLPYVCIECGARFLNSRYLQNHFQDHTKEEKNEVLNSNGNNFKSNAKVTDQFCSDTGEKPYQCKECGIGYNIKRSLTNHIRIHTGIGPYICDP